jgi:hypothetical protein
MDVRPRNRFIRGSTDRGHRDASAALPWERFTWKPVLLTQKFCFGSPGNVYGSTPFEAHAFPPARAPRRLPRPFRAKKDPVGDESAHHLPGFDLPRLTLGIRKIPLGRTYEVQKKVCETTGLSFSATYDGRKVSDASFPEKKNPRSGFIRTRRGSFPAFTSLPIAPNVTTTIFDPSRLRSSAIPSS